MPSIEASHDEAGIKWPSEIAPFDVGIINLKVGDEQTSKLCEDVYTKISATGLDVLYDDRDTSAGAKFANMDLIGAPWQIIVGPKGVKMGMVEMKQRMTGEKFDVKISSLIETITTKLSDLKKGY